MQVIRSNVISVELLSKLKEAFPSPTVRPGVDQDKLMYQAGQHDVVQFIIDYVGKSGVKTLDSHEPERVPAAERMLRQDREERKRWWQA